MNYEVKKNEFVLLLHYQFTDSQNNKKKKFTLIYFIFR